MTELLTVLVDVDSVLNIFDEHFWDRCTARGYVFDIEHHSHQKKRWFTDHIPDKKHRNAARRMVDKAGWFRDIPVMPGSQEGIKALAEKAEVYLCTKPLEINPTCHQDKFDWVKEHFPDFTDRLIITGDKSMIRGDILLDDAPKPKWFDKAEWVPVVYSQPQNSHVDSDLYHLPHWDWSQPVDDLLSYAKEHA
jgi:5'-nucleotidase